MIAYLTITVLLYYRAQANPISNIKYKSINEKEIVYDPEQDWWKNAVLYQIYPRSFKDSNGDGIGDLPGIIEKLDYLQETGITAAWLSPIFLSPNHDQGYDIQDYRKIDPIYGTLENLRELVDKAHELGIKILLDFVPNHTSDQHDWFQLSVNKTQGYEDYYVWKNSKDGGPPNNWLSAFGHSAWEWNEERKQYYLHQYSIYQPDLNYRSEKLVEEMKEVLKFWLEFGIDGFRVDAVPKLVEDENFDDEPMSGLDVEDYDYKYLSHIYTVDQNETFDVVYGWREVFDDFNQNKTYPRIMVTQAFSPSDKVFRYYGDENGTLGAHFTFNFNLIAGVKRNFTVEDVVTSITDWLWNIPADFTSNWVLGNHDVHRIASRLSSKHVNPFNLLVSILPGVQVVYNGEEIGMEDGQVSCEQGQDPQATKNCTTFNETSRDFERTPFQWDDSDNAGFSNGTTTWLPVAENYEKLNLKTQQNDSLSHYNIFRKGLEIKASLSNTTGNIIYIIESNTTILELIRKTDSVVYVLLYNYSGDDNASIVPHTIISEKFVVEVVSGNYNRKIGDYMNKEEEVLLPNEVVIYKNTGINSSYKLQANIFIFIMCKLIFKII